MLGICCRQKEDFYLLFINIIKVRDLGSQFGTFRKFLNLSLQLMRIIRMRKKKYTESGCLNKKVTFIRLILMRDKIYSQWLIYNNMVKRITKPPSSPYHFYISIRDTGQSITAPFAYSEGPPYPSLTSGDFHSSGPASSSPHPTFASHSNALLGYAFLIPVTPSVHLISLGLAQILKFPDVSAGFPDAFVFLPAYVFVHLQVPFVHFRESPVLF